MAVSAPVVNNDLKPPNVNTSRYNEIVYNLVLRPKC
jgi:hypothetical protein